MRIKTLTGTVFENVLHFNRGSYKKQQFEQVRNSVNQIELLTFSTMYDAV